MERQSLLAPGSIFDSRYEIVALVGVGGMGEVYKARHLQLDKTIALKILRSEVLQDATIARRFQHEAQMATALRHEHIAEVQTFGVSQGHPYIALEFLNGESLQSILERDGCLSFERFIQLFLQVCDALMYAHSKGIIHRDLKPGNIFVVRENDSEKIYLVDFGIAKALDATDPGQKMTKTGAVIGTPLYMSPEQCRSEQVTAQSDIYSLGCVMYHAIYGKPPFDAESPYEVMMQHGYAEPALNTVPPGYPAAITKLVQGSMAKTVEHRYQNMNEVKQDIVRLKSGSAPQGTDAPRRAIKRVSAKVPQPLKQSALILCLVAGGLAGFGLYWNHIHSPQNELKRLRARHDFKEFSQIIPPTGTPANADEILGTVREALPILAASQNLDALQTIADACALRRRCDKKPSSDFVYAAVTLVKDLPSTAWAEHGERIASLSLDILMDRLLESNLRDHVSENFQFARGLASYGDTSRCVILGREALNRFKQAKPRLTLNAHQYMELADLSDAFDELDPKLATDIITESDAKDYPTVRWHVAQKLARLNDRLGNTGTAIGYWKEAAKRAEHPGGATPAIDTMQALADDEWLAGDKAAALDLYAAVGKRLVNVAPDGAEAARHLRLAESYYRAGDRQTARKLLRETIPLAKKDIDYIGSASETNKTAMVLAYWAEGVAQLLLDDTTSATKSFVEATNHSSEHSGFFAAPFWFSMSGMVAVEAKNQSLPPEQRRPSAAFWNEFVDATWNLQRGDYRRMADHLDAMKNATPSKEAKYNILLMESAISIYEHDLKRGLEVGRQLITVKAPDKPLVTDIEALADCLYQAGQFDQSKKCYSIFLKREREIAAFTEHRALAHMRVGQLYMRDKQYQEALKEFATVRELSPDAHRSQACKNALIGQLDALREVKGEQAAERQAQEMIQIESQNH